MMLIDFIQDFNNSLPSSEEIKNKFGGDFNAIAFSNNLKLSCSSKDENLPISSILTLLQKTNISDIYIAGFSFHLQPLNQSDVYSDFALFNDFYFFATDTKGQIVSYAYSFEDIEVVAPSVEVFLETLLAYNKYNIQVIYQSNYSLDPFANKIEYFIENKVSKRWLKDFFPQPDLNDL